MELIPEHRHGRISQGRWPQRSYLHTGLQGYIKVLFCFSVVLALVLGAVSFMSKSCLSVTVARSEAKHSPLVSLHNITLTSTDPSFPVSIWTPQPIPQGSSCLYGQAAISFLLTAPTFLGDELAAGQPPLPSSGSAQGAWDHHVGLRSPGAPHPT